VLACAAPAAQPKSPAIVLLDAADAQQWQEWTRDLGWRVLAPSGVKAEAAIDTRVQAVAAVVQEALKDSGVDPARVYLAGRGEEAAAVFYTISRVPDLWAAGLALGGGPQPAIDTGRLFAANFTNTPVLWISNGADDQALAGKLRDSGLNLEWRSAAGATTGAAFEWLARHKREEFPVSIDCETNAPAFARCYWIQMTKFDPRERNDVLPSSVLRGGSGAALDLGGFGYKTTDPGPGVLVSYLPPKYTGPLKLGDRIVALDGKEIKDGRHYAVTMAGTWDEKPAVAMIERGKEHLRTETRIVLPRRDPLTTARVQGKYVPEEKSIQIISRTATEMRVTIPPQWVPGNLYWNGLSMEGLKEPGCWLLAIEKELLRSSPCGK
jgi:predicted esterase